MLTEYTIQVKLHSGGYSYITVRAYSSGEALGQARAFGEPLGITESRYVDNWCG